MLLGLLYFTISRTILVMVKAVSYGTALLVRKHACAVAWERGHLNLDSPKFIAPHPCEQSRMAARTTTVQLVRGWQLSCCVLPRKTYGLLGGALFTMIDFFSVVCATYIVMLFLCALAIA